MLWLVNTLREAAEKINLSDILSFDHELAPHTSFRIGGKARAYAKPRDSGEVLSLVGLAQGEGLPYFILGGGSNLLVADSGFNGLVIDLTGLNRLEQIPGGLRAQAGASVESACEFALQAGLSGLEWFYGLPGSLGGAFYMNARCYEHEFSECAREVECLLGGELRRETFAPGEWDYKKSPFQAGGRLAGAIILSCSLSLSPGERGLISAVMAEKKQDREKKKQYLFPSGGSVFKNDRRLGQPTGMVLDRLGFRGRACGGASVADFHANMIINRGGAKASEVLSLIRSAQKAVREETGFEIEPELVFVGDVSGED
jgi:UDP-N-acetylmuramate dehydrogenase